VHQSAEKHARTNRNTCARVLTVEFENGTKPTDRSRCWPQTFVIIIIIIYRDTNLRKCIPHILAAQRYLDILPNDDDDDDDDITNSHCCVRSIPDHLLFNGGFLFYFLLSSIIIIIIIITTQS
jgi:hypothetical protein